jgi:hypothetical protein
MNPDWTTLDDSDDICFDVETVLKRYHTAVEVPRTRVSWAPLPWLGNSPSISTPGTPEVQLESRKVSLESVDRCVSMNRQDEKLNDVIDHD